MKEQTEMSPKNPFMRLLSWLWTGVNGIRKILHLVLLLFVFALFFGLNAEAPSIQPAGSALYIQPYGALVEQLAGDPYDRAIAELVGDGLPQTRVSDIVDALHYARDDDRVKMVYLDLSMLGSGGLSKLQTVAEAIKDFQSSGKPVVANADFFGQQSYYLAAHADEVYMHPDGVILLRGYGHYRQFYKDAIDLLRIDWNVFRVGTHKSFVEPYTRMDMSNENRADTSRVFDQLWSMYRTAVVEARGLEEGAIEDFSTNLIQYVTASGGDVAAAALEFGLVDGLLSRNGIRDYMVDRVGKSDWQKDSFNAIDMHEYLAQMDLFSSDSVQSENVAVIVAAGDIMFGEQSPGNIGADSTAALLRRARESDLVDAVVLRVDSPGGSAFAAEVIADEVRALQAAGKPVVASMSSVAASGGYTISMHADQVLADPSTITGSIGVFGMFPTYQRSLEAIGIASDGVGTTPWSGQLRPEREMSDQARQLLQLFVEDAYDDFITDVALSRGLEKSVVDGIGQGQIWTGVEAMQHGLVDGLGGQQAAIELAAELAGLDADGYGTFVIEQELSPSEQMLVGLLSVSARTGLDLSRWVRTPDILTRLSQSIDRRLDSMLRFNDPKGMYAHCLCDLN